MKRCGLLILSCLLIGQLGVVSAFSMASRSAAPSLLVMPAQFAPLQLGFDVASRYSTVLVAYQSQGVGREPLLHVWDGAQWLRIGMEDMRTFSFLTVRPSRVLLVGDENTLPSSLVEATAGAAQYVLPSTETATMVNHFGHFYDFRSQDWRWFAARYGLDLGDLNQARRDATWYDQPTEKVPAFNWRRGRQQGRTTTTTRREAPRAAAPVVAAPVMPPERAIEVEASRPAVRPGSPIVAPAPTPTPALEREISIVPPQPETIAVPEAPEGWEERAVATEAPPVK